MGSDIEHFYDRRFVFVFFNQLHMKYLHTFGNVTCTVTKVPNIAIDNELQFSHQHRVEVQVL